MADLNGNISILIPTMDRSLFVIRALKFYAAVGFQGYVCIGDSSSEHHFQNTRQEVQRLNRALNIIHKYYPSSEYPNEATVVKSLVDLAPTQYVCQYGDDDFLIPSGVNECVRFLDSNNRYVAASGRVRVEFSLEDGVLYFGKIGETIKVDENNFDKESASDRFVTYMRNALAPTYNVFRKEIFKKMYKDTDIAITRYFGPEVLTSAMGAICGKTKALDVLTLMFQVHDNHIFSWYEQSIYDMLIEPSFSKSIDVIRDNLVQGLKEEDHLSQEQAIEIVDRELWLHIYRMLGWQHKERYHATKKRQGSVVDQIKAVRGLGVPLEISLIGSYWWIRRFIKNNLSKKESKRFLLDSLSQPSSKFFGEFSLVSEFLLAPPADIVDFYREDRRENK